MKSEILTAQAQNTFEENPDLERLRRRFESEQDIDGFDNDRRTSKNVTENTESYSIKNNENHQNQIQEEQTSSIQNQTKTNGINCSIWQKPVSDDFP